MKLFASVLIACTACTTLVSTQAAIWQFDLGGVAGSGILGGNEIDSLADSPGSGKEMPYYEVPGIIYDDVAKVLEFHVGWGAHEAVRMTSLTYPVVSSALYGPAEMTENSPNALYSFTESNGYRPMNDSGGRTGFIDSRIVLQDLGDYSVAEQEADLLNSRWYFNIISTTYDTGEIRAQLLTGIPEPEHYVLFTASGLLGLAMYRRIAQKPKLTP